MGFDTMQYNAILTLKSESSYDRSLILLESDFKLLTIQFRIPYRLSLVCTRKYCAKRQVAKGKCAYEINKRFPRISNDIKLRNKTEPWWLSGLMCQSMSPEFTT